MAGAAVPAGVAETDAAAGADTDAGDADAGDADAAAGASEVDCESSVGGVLP